MEFILELLRGMNLIIELQSVVTADAVAAALHLDLSESKKSGIGRPVLSIVKAVEKQTGTSVDVLVQQGPPREICVAIVDGLPDMPSVDQNLGETQKWGTSPVVPGRYCTFMFGACQATITSTPNGSKVQTISCRAKSLAGN